MQISNRPTPEAVKRNPTPTNDKPIAGSNEQHRRPARKKSTAPAKTAKVKRAANGRFK